MWKIVRREICFLYALILAHRELVEISYGSLALSGYDFLCGVCVCGLCGAGTRACRNRLELPQKKRYIFFLHRPACLTAVLSSVSRNVLTTFAWTGTKK